MALLDVESFLPEETTGTGAGAAAVARRAATAADVFCCSLAMAVIACATVICIASTAFCMLLSICDCSLLVRIFALACCASFSFAAGS